MSDKDYLEGVRAAQAYYNSQAYATLSRYIKPEDAAKLFLPPVNEMLIMTSTPLPKPRKDWIKGFKEEQANILTDIKKEIDDGP